MKKAEKCFKVIEKKQGTGGVNSRVTRDENRAEDYSKGAREGS